MTVITISRQYGSQGDEIALMLCEKLGYRYFDKQLMIEEASELGLSEREIIDFSEDNYKVGGLLERIFKRGAPRVIAEVSTWTENTSGARAKKLIELDEAYGIGLIKSAIQVAYERGNVVIVGRGGQAVLQENPGVFHVRIEAPKELRIAYAHKRHNLTREAARQRVNQHDQTGAAYLKNFYDLDWADPMLYHLILNTEKWEVDLATQLIINGMQMIETKAPAQVEVIGAMS